MALKIKNKNILKIALDIVMSLLFVLMFNSNVISLNFHELGGLFVCALFLFHKLLNWKWISAVSKKLFRKDLNFKIRFCYSIDFLLLISVLAILVSGILISKTLFADISSHNSIWKTIHYFASAISLILVGIHVGLHWGFVIGMFKKFIKVPQAVARPLSIILTIAVIGFGLYCTYTSDLTKWLSSPFLAGQTVNFEEKRRPSDSEFNNDKIPENSDKEIKSGKVLEKGKELPSEGIPFNRGNFQGKHPGGSNAVNVAVTFLSIIGFFAAITYYSALIQRKYFRL